MKTIVKFFKSIRYYFYVGRIALDSAALILKYRLRGGITNTKEEKIVICMIDGEILHGGMTDRLRGFVSIYSFCKEYHHDFKIYHRFPFLLENILSPNKYDWHIDDNNVSFNAKEVLPIFLNTRGYMFEKRFQYKYLKKKIEDSNYKQYHIYTNAYFGDNNYSKLFNELFIPSPKLHTKLLTIKNELPNNYISCVFRFQQLLEDFKEGNYKILDDEQQQKIVMDCINQLELLYQKKKCQILVTSDSYKFLMKAKKLSYVKIIEGRNVHMDFCTDASLEDYMKSFEDYFSLANGQEIYLLVTNHMYKSGFAKRAAMLYNRPYRELRF